MEEDGRFLFQEKFYFNEKLFPFSGSDQFGNCKLVKEFADERVQTQERPRVWSFAKWGIDKNH